MVLEPSWNLLAGGRSGRVEQRPERSISSLVSPGPPQRGIGLSADRTAGVRPGPAARGTAPRSGSPRRCVGMSRGQRCGGTGLGDRRPRIQRRLSVMPFSLRRFRGPVRTLATRADRPRIHVTTRCRRAGGPQAPARAGVRAWGWRQAPARRNCRSRSRRRQPRHGWRRSSAGCQPGMAPRMRHGHWPAPRGRRRAGCPRPG